MLLAFNEGAIKELQKLIEYEDKNVINPGDLPNASKDISEP